ncbi:SPFH domain-containing protein [Erysipelothrix urinaevulpis]|uniref:SPFH domain-containing protein n=1 Tax=Erysipelothrix urinaevulpis TaxID=2683717 RepID=UPI00135A1945|nr:SPFH domain-containing protein [Erysipelothrix urinaevulpis]
MALIDIVKYNGNEKEFAWRFPNDELSTKTQLIVNESQVAVLFKGGKAYDVYEAGRHTLETMNMPLLNKLINLPFGGETPFKAEVWFVNMTHSLDIKWGTSSPVNIQDPKYGIYIPISAYGQFGITVNNPKEFLKKLVGTLPSFGQHDVINYFRGFYTTNVKDEISNYLVNKKITILELGAHLKELSEYMKNDMAEGFNSYGLELLNFYVEDISVPETDEGISRLKAALNKKAEMDIVGYDYKEERGYDALVGAAKNEGQAGTVAGAGIGLGMGTVMGHELGTLLKESNENLKKEDNIMCPDCGYESSKDSKFCSNCSKTFQKECGQCGQIINNENQKFCDECGSSLLKKCHQCEAVLSNNAKFCHDCGEKVVE